MQPISRQHRSNHAWQFLLAALFAAAIPAHALECSATSGANKLAVLELYTSEGCDSCPPADRWVSGLPAKGLRNERLLALAFHVDYWDYLGWRDPFAQARFTERQRTIAARNRASFVYTPQLILNGKDYRRGALFDDFADKVKDANQAKPQAGIALSLRVNGRSVEIAAKASIPDPAARPRAQAFLALVESGLSSDIKSGENKGKLLQHDFVVRELAGPFKAGADGELRLQQTFRLQGPWRSGAMQVATFLENPANGEVLQALVTSCS